MPTIYLDHSATTPVDQEVVNAMLPYYTGRFGNASSIHRFGQDARTAIEKSRAKIAGMLGASESEIVFLSGGTEADNLAILGINLVAGGRTHVITSMVEHHAVVECCEFLQKKGNPVTFLRPDPYGMIDPEQVREAMTAKTRLVSIMHANNEVGTINPVEAIGEVVHNGDGFFHTDAVQSFGKLPIDVEKMNIDLLSISGHKIYGPKGIGALYVRNGTPIGKLIHGGEQERNKRGGTENVAAIVGLAKAAEICVDKMKTENERLTKLNHLFWQLLKDRISNISINGHPDIRIPGHLSLSIEGVDADSMLIGLDLKGIAASSGSACASGSNKASHVLTGIGLSPEMLRGTLRFSLGRSNTEEDIPYIADSLSEIVERLRSLITSS